MTVHVCSHCDHCCAVTSLYCQRCGACLERVSHEELALRHLALARILIRNTVLSALKFLLRKISALIKADSSLLVSCQSSIQWLAQDCIDFLIDTDLPARLSVISAVLELLRGEAGPLLRREAETLASYRQALLGTEQDIRSGVLRPGKKLTKWFESILTKHQFSDVFALDLIYTNPLEWSSLAETLDLGRFNECRQRHETLRGRAELHDRNYGRARTVFENVLRQDNDYAPAWEALGATLIALKDIPQAVTAFRMAFRLGPSDLMTCNSLAWHLCTSQVPNDGDLDLAERASGRAVEFAPTASCWDTRAEVLEKLNRPTDAISAIRRASTLSLKSKSTVTGCVD